MYGYKLTFLLAFATAAIASLAGLQRDVCNQDNLYRCFTHSPSVAVPFCSGYVTPTTIYVATVTPTTTLFSTLTSTTTGTVPSSTTTTTVTTSTSTVTTTITSKSTSLTTSTVSTTTTITASVLGRLVRRHGGAEALKERAAAGPPCLTTESPHATSYPASRITSACSCIGVTQQTIVATFTASQVTSYTTSTASTTATATTVIIVTETLSTATTTTSSTTTTTTTTTSTTTTTTATSSVFGA